MTAPVHDDGSEPPDFAEAIEAWRVWRVLDREGAFSLASAVKPTVWPAREALTARCLRDSPLRTWLRRRRRVLCAAPDVECSCGIYGADLEHSVPYLRDGLSFPSVGRILGRVALWGKVIECEQGFRASHAYPLRIYVPVDPAPDADHRWDELVTGLGHYGIPIAPLPAQWSAAGWVLDPDEVSALERAQP